MGVFLIFLSYGALIARTVLKVDDNRLKLFGNNVVGFALMIVIISGLAMVFMYGHGFQLWVIIKLVIWVMLGGLTAVANRKAELGMPLWWAVVVLGGLAAYTALAKPFLG